MLIECVWFITLWEGSSAARGRQKKLCCQERCVHQSVEGNKSRSVPSAAVPTVTSQVVQGLIREAMIHTATTLFPLPPAIRIDQVTSRPASSYFLAHPRQKKQKKRIFFLRLDGVLVVAFNVTREGGAVFPDGVFLSPYLSSHQQQCCSKGQKKVDTDQMDQNNSESLFFHNAMLHHVEMKTGRRNDQQGLGIYQQGFKHLFHFTAVYSYSCGWTFY